jgi:predicted RNase H-like HicB family nuclease
MYNNYMNIDRPRNTKERGVIEYLVFKENDRYVGVCLTFGIVEEGNDPVVIMEGIKEAARLHLEVVIKENMSDDLLNRYAPDEYWNIYHQALEHIKQPMKKPLESPFFSRFPYHLSPTVITA